MNLTVILKDEAIILFIIFQFAIVFFTLKHIFSTYCESFYGCELFNFTKPYNVKFVYFMAENYTIYFLIVSYKV